MRKRPGNKAVSRQYKTQSARSDHNKGTRPTAKSMMRNSDRPKLEDIQSEIVQRFQDESGEGIVINKTHEMRRILEDDHE